MKNVYLFSILNEENFGKLFEGADGVIYQIGRQDGDFVLCSAWGDHIFCSAKHITQTYVEHSPRVKKYFSSLETGDCFYIIADFEEAGLVLFDEDESEEYWKHFLDNGYAFRELKDAQAKLEELQLLGRIAKYQNEHDTIDIDWDNLNQRKWHIAYSDVTESLWVAENKAGGRILGLTYFGSRHVAKDCIEEFEDELLEYFRRKQL